MALASLSRMKSRVNATLILNDGAYSATNSGVVGRYSSDAEITDAILQKDLEVCAAIIDVPNHPARPAFLVGVSSNLLNGALLPSSLGAIGQVTLSNDGTTFSPGKLGKSKDEIEEVAEIGLGVYGQTAADLAGFYFIEDNRIYHTSAAARVTYPVLGMGAGPQAPDVYEAIIIAGAVSSLLRDGGDASLHQIYETQYQNGLQNIRAFPRTFPEQSVAEKQTTGA